MKVEIRNPFVRYRTITPVIGESMTEQSHAEAADINFIVKRFSRTGQLPPARHAPVYADVTQLQGDLADRLRWSASVIDQARAIHQQQQEVPLALTPTPAEPPPA